MTELIVNLIVDYGTKIIWCFAGINLVIFFSIYIIQKKADELIYTPRKNKIHQSRKKNNNTPNSPNDFNEKDVDEISKKKQHLITLYALYANITTAFPLLGILGTVAALINYSNETMMENFMVALNTTLWGVLFAFVFKTFDAAISGPLDIFIDNADFAIQEYIRNNKAEETKDAE